MAADADAGRRNEEPKRNTDATLSNGNSRQRSGGRSVCSTNSPTETCGKTENQEGIAESLMVNNGGKMYARPTMVGGCGLDQSGHRQRHRHRRHPHRLLQCCAANRIRNLPTLIVAHHKVCFGLGAALACSTTRPSTCCSLSFSRRTPSTVSSNAPLACIT